MSPATATHKLLILEENTTLPPEAKYDHVFSFRAYEHAQSFPHDYISAEEVGKLYFKAYDMLCSRLLDPQWDKIFFYRGVSLLGCFKKEFFDKTFNWALRYEIVKRVLARYNDSEIHFNNENRPKKPAFLFDLIEKSPLKNNPHVHIVNQVHPPSVTSFPDLAPRPKKILQKMCLSLPVYSVGDLSRVKVAVFSDFGRSKSIIERVRHAGCVIFSNQAAPRTLLRALIMRAAYFQTAYQTSTPAHRQMIGDLIEQSRRHRIFRDFAVNELQLEFFLQRNLERLFNTVLPRLFFKIDGIEIFFRLSPMLRTALLDEDIDPTKNAFAQLARRRGIKTFVELHGAMGGKHGIVPLTADQILVWGRTQKKRLMSWGCPEEKIVVTGCSRYGRYQKMNTAKIRSQVARSFRLNPASKIGLLIFTPISRWHVWHEQRIKQNINEALELAAEMARQQGAQFIIKLHPFDWQNPFYSSWVKKHRMGKWIKVVGRYDSMLLAKAADFLVVYGSTYAVDGFAMDKPVILLYPDEEPIPLLEEFKPFSVFPEASSFESLRQILLRLIQGQTSQPERWKEGQVECLNMHGKDPDEIIASLLLHV
ncbi:MAG: hypothetical protein HYZ84_05330 [Candidatus Omnitrophica bacterium]|nr:hypothetical protein [Candidatus Omnitrophota bacterium]